MDAQGVSMCEAMSSGLIPITSNNTAIPEFVTHKKTGFLTESVNEIVDSVNYLYNNPTDYLKMSREASLSIAKISGIDVVMKKEMQLIKKILS